MKNKILTITFYSLLLGVLFPSCSIEKRRYATGYFSQLNTSSYKPFKKPLADTIEKINVIVNSNKINPIEFIEIENDNYSASINDHPQIYSDKRKCKINSSFIDNTCDTIILKSGTQIEGKVTEITLTEIKYKKCINLDGPTISLAKADVYLIKYTNGTKDIINEVAVKVQDDYVNPNPIPRYSNSPTTPIYTNPNSTPKNPASRVNTEGPKKTEGFGVWGFILGILGIFVGGIPLGITAIIFGAISLTKINKHPEKYKRKKGLPIAAIIIGVIALLGGIIVLMLTF